MKIKSLLTIAILALAVSCSKKEDTANLGEPVVNVEESASVETGTAEVTETTGTETADCVCTKEFKPVCGDGVEYGNACEAGCAKAANIVEGPCAKN